MDKEKEAVMRYVAENFNPQDFDALCRGYVGHNYDRVDNKFADNLLRGLMGIVHMVNEYKFQIERNTVLRFDSMVSHMVENKIKPDKTLKHHYECMVKLCGRGHKELDDILGVDSDKLRDEKIDDMDVPIMGE